jgi:malonate decarboxylase epsilon subunit
MSVAFLFPGQGSQQPGMLHELPDCAATSETIETAESVLGRKVLQLDSEAALCSTVAAQLSLLIAGVALGRALLREGATPDLVAGMSVGSFAAAVIAGSIDFSDALLLVRLRSELMEHAFPKGYGMAAILGLDESRMTDLVARVNTPESPVYLANLNAPRQIIASGSRVGLEQLMEEAGVAGANTTKLLNVVVPSHCRLLQPVEEALARAIEGVTVRAPRFDIIGNRGGRRLRDPAAIRLDLVSNVAHAVRWHDATTLMFELGARLFIELPPGHVLTRLAAEAFPEARAVACGETRLDSVVRMVRLNTGL